jgi:hypothetical protein
MTVPAQAVPMEAFISRQCRGNMHLHCNAENCGCQVCHHRCQSCNRRCRTIYLVPDDDRAPEDLRGKHVCSKCYLVATALLPHGQGCDECHGPKGFRDPRDEDDRYLCLGCRRALGLPSGENGTW